MSNIGSAGKMTSTGRVTSKVGQLLQEARRQRGLEIKDIAASTHVRSEYLLALEEGRFTELPENVYTRNFLRLYAEAVGLDEQEVLEHYSLERYGKSDAPRKSVYPSPAYDPATETYKEESSVVDDTTKKRRGVGWLIPLIALAVLGLVGYMGWRNFVFPNEETGGYTATIPGINREFNIPSFNRTADPNAGTSDSTSTTGTTTDSTSTTAGTEDATSTATVAGADSGTDTGADSATGDASATTSTDTTGPDGTETGGTELTVPAPGENASEGQLITPTAGTQTTGTQDASAQDSGTQDATSTDGTDVAATTAATATNGAEAADGFVMLSVITEPVGAEVSIDNFFLGTTPQVDFPVTPGGDKLLRISLDGYQTIEQTFDSTTEQNFVFTLQEATAGGDEITDVEGDATTLDSISITSDGTVLATDDPSLTPAAELQGKAVITIEDGGEAWLEVYQGTTRDGSTLVYRVANDSDRFEFDLPVFIRAGRSSLVKVSVNGGLPSPLGPVDQVAEQVFSE